MPETVIHPDRITDTVIQRVHGFKPGVIITLVCSTDDIADTIFDHMMSYSEKHGYLDICRLRLLVGERDSDT